MTRRSARRALTMLSLVLAGEVVFIPPFHLGRYFKSSLLATFEMTEFQLGQLGAIYGVFAMGSYLVGGPLADRVSPRKLIPLSLVATGLGCLYMATVPGFRGLYALFAFWGTTTILLFWAPLIRAVREWGGEERQGSAFGLLDGGRGLAAAVFAAAAAAAFGVVVGADVVLDPARETAAIGMLLHSYAALCLAAAILAWFFVPDPRPAEVEVQTERSAGPGLARQLWLVARTPAVWLMVLVIIAAYSAFKMFDNYGLYAEDAYGLTRAESAKLVAMLSFLRPAAALAAGWIADRFLGVSRTIAISFGVLLVAYVAFVAVAPSPGLAWLMVANMAVSCAAFFALRGIYFALLEESSIPRAVTGTAVGVVSFLGFTPEIFMPLMTGWLITRARDAGDVLAGFDQVFLVLAGLMLAGIAATVALRRLRPTP